jgi:hypothetical protein
MRSGAEFRHHRSRSRGQSNRVMSRRDSKDVGAMAGTDGRERSASGSRSPEAGGGACVQASPPPAKGPASVAVTAGSPCDHGCCDGDGPESVELLGIAPAPVIMQPTRDDRGAGFAHDPEILEALTRCARANAPCLLWFQFRHRFRAERIIKATNRSPLIVVADAVGKRRHVPLEAIERVTKLSGRPW